MRKEKIAFSMSVGELAKEMERKGRHGIPEEFIPNCHLIYSSPATLAYNSPGAIGFGVKRAALVIPESVMLLVSPDCCGRNSTILSQEEGYAEKMFYLLMNETDLVTGKHLEEIPEAVKEILQVCRPRPKVVVLCITCADALLGTDLERICRMTAEKTGVAVVPSYMYALEREGKKPPMVAIRKTIYSLLERKTQIPDMVNLMGFFSPLDESCELIPLLQTAGIRKVNQIAEMDTLQEYQEMGNANFNLVLERDAVYGAESLLKRIGMPYVELFRLYDPEKIHRQYRLLGEAAGISIRDEKLYREALDLREEAKSFCRGKKAAVGEMANANPYELAASLAGIGMEVRQIFANLSPSDFPWLKRLASVSPDTRVFTGISPSMVWYEPDEEVELTIGKDAGIYIPEAVNVRWNSENQPFGYQAVRDLFKEMRAAL